MAKARTLADKLLIKAGVTVAVINAPEGMGTVEGAESAALPKDAGAALLFAATAKEVDKHLPKLAKVMAQGTRLWIAYPKAGKLGTDLNRDKLWTRVEPLGWEGVRLVSIDDTWAAMMFRRA